MKEASCTECVPNILFLECELCTVFGASSRTCTPTVPTMLPKSAPYKRATLIPAASEGAQPLDL